MCVCVCVCVCVYAYTESVSITISTPNVTRSGLPYCKRRKQIYVWS